MITPELIAYIRNELAKGTVPEVIKSTLLSQGWNAPDINEGLAQANAQSLSSVAPASIATMSVVSYAGFWSRFVALIIDSALLALMYGVITIMYVVVLFNTNPASGEIVTLMLGILQFGVWILYFPYMESRNGATIGKKIMGIQVTRTNNQPVSFLRSLGRNLSKIISGMIFLIGYIMVAFTEKKQALHDIIADCVVIKKKEESVAKFILVIVIISVIGIGIVVLAGINFYKQWSYELGVETPNSDPFFGMDPSLIDSSVEWYDEYMGKPISGLSSEEEYSGPSITVGPALIAFDDFWGLNVALPYLAILEDNTDYSWIDIHSAVDARGVNIHDAQSSFETDQFFKGLRLSRETDPVVHLKDSRDIHLISEYDLNDLRMVTGTLYFKIPLGSKDSGEFYEKSFLFNLTIPGNNQ